MNIIIAGAGKLGNELIRKLASEGHDLTVIENKTDVLEECLTSFDVMGIHGNCAAKKVLESANIDKADILIATTGADEVNLLCCLTAKRLNEKLRTIARIRTPEYTEQVIHMRDAFGLSLVINPEQQASHEITRLLNYPGSIKCETIAKGRVEIVEIYVDAKSRLRNTPLSKLTSIVRCKVLVCAVLRDGNCFVPNGSFVLEENDRVYVTAHLEELTMMLAHLGIVTHKVDNVMICGGGRLCYYLASRLIRAGKTVTIMERNEERANVLREILPKAIIVHGDCSKHSVLLEEGLATNDALVSLTGLDELNIITAMFGKSLGMTNVITKLSRMANESLISTMSLGSIVSPNEYCAKTVMRYVRGMQERIGTAITLSTFAEGAAQALEFRIDANSPFVGIPLRKLDMCANTLISCIYSGSEVKIPDGNSVYEAGDTIVVVSSNPKEFHVLRDIFA